MLSIDQLNRLSEEDAAIAFEQCCGANQWVERMVYSRPFESLTEVLETSDNVWEECDVDDYEDAFSYHVRIGDPEEMADLADAGSDLEDLGRKWSQQELKSLENMSPDLLGAFAQANAAYEERFGFLFVVCAPGKPPQEILGMLKERLANDPGTEIRLAAEEQNKITRMRLKKLLA